MKNKKITLRTCIIACFICVLLTSVVAGSTTTEKITAYINRGISIIIDGQTKTMLDADGNRVYPISYDGTTYVPIRAISELLNAKVSWDSKTGSVVIESNCEEKVSLIPNKTVATTYSTLLTDEEKTVVSQGKTYKAENGVLCEIVKSQDYASKNYIVLPIEDKINSISFDCYSDVKCSVNVFNQNGKLLKTVYVSPNTITNCTFSVNSEINTQIYCVGVGQNNENSTKASVKIMNLFGYKK